MRTSRMLRAAGAVLAGTLAIRAIARAFSPRGMDGHVVFITGGSRGLGFAIALEAASRGARIVLCGRAQDTVERAVERLRERGTEVLGLTCDVRDPQSVTAAVRAAFEQFGRIDMLVNNAGTIAVGPLESMTRQDYEDAMNTHFWGTYNAVEAVRPIMQHQGGGRIANITSIGGKVSVPHLLAYSASKFAAVGYSEGLRAELASKRISVTTVCPGLMRTGSPRNAFFKAQHRKEYTWFALSDTLPGISIGARAAARAVLDAALRNQAEIVLSVPAQSIALLHGVAPAFVSNVMRLGALLLPGPGGVEQHRMRGHESATAATKSPLTALGKKAEREYNQIG